MVANNGDERAEWLLALNAATHEYYQKVSTNGGDSSSSAAPSTTSSSSALANIDVLTLGISEVARIMDVISIFGPTKPHVARDGCIAVSNLAGSNDFNKAKLGQVGICPVSAYLVFRSDFITFSRYNLHCWYRC